MMIPTLPACLTISLDQQTEEVCVSYWPHYGSQDPDERISDSKTARTSPREFTDHPDRAIRQVLQRS